MLSRHTKQDTAKSYVYSMRNAVIVCDEKSRTVSYYFKVLKKRDQCPIHGSYHNTSTPTTPPPAAPTPHSRHTTPLTLFAWNLSINNYDVWDEITYPFTNFNGAAVTRVTLYYAYGYLSILKLKIIHDGKMGPAVIVEHGHKLAYREYVIHCIQCAVYG